MAVVWTSTDDEFHHVTRVRMCLVYIRYPDGVRCHRVIMDFNRKALIWRRGRTVWTSWRGLSAWEAIRYLLE